MKTFSALPFTIHLLSVVFSQMHRNQGNHDIRCGTVATEGLQLLIINGTSGQRGEVPWHSAIYTKTTKPYQQICGGSLISNDIIISAAHCFWNLGAEMKQPATNYAVSVGKLYRPWKDYNEQGQKSDVKEVHLPVLFQGSAANYQDDIAIVVVTTKFKYDTFVRPICVDFDDKFDKTQLQLGHIGKVAGWGLTEENGHESQVLKVTMLPYIDTETCISESPASYRGFITSDKMCAGFKNAGIAMCKGDSGGGLAFANDESGVTQYYLRGIVSSAPTGDSICNANFYTSFTRVQHHAQFITKFWMPESFKCVVPAHPANGRYKTNKESAKPGDRFESIILNITCSEGYEVRGSSSVYCYSGWWPKKVPTCAPLCRLFQDLSVEYECVEGNPEKYRPCNAYEPSGTVARPSCNLPTYASSVPLRRMRCINGTWDFVPSCKLRGNTLMDFDNDGIRGPKFSNINTNEYNVRMNNFDSNPLMGEINPTHALLRKQMEARHNAFIESANSRNQMETPYDAFMQSANARNQMEARHNAFIQSANSRNQMETPYDAFMKSANSRNQMEAQHNAFIQSANSRNQMETPYETFIQSVDSPHNFLQNQIEQHTSMSNGIEPSNNMITNRVVSQHSTWVNGVPISDSGPIITSNNGWDDFF